MSEILQDFTPAAVIPAIEGNLEAFAGLYARCPSVQFRRDAVVTWVLTGIPHPFFNGVFRAQFGPEDVDRRIQDTLAPFQAQGIPMVWMTGPSTRPADLGTRLLTHGLIQEDRPGAGAEDPGMGVDLQALNEARRAAPGVTIQPVEDRTGLQHWIDAAIRGFELPEELTEPLVELFAGVGFDLPVRHYVALRDGEPVASSILVLGSGVAGVYCVSTVPEARRQGIGTAITLAPLREARDLGYRIGTLQSAPMGYSAYRQIGFEEYCQFSIYLWLGAPEQR